MGRLIGFFDFPKAWEGPAILEFGHFRTHTKTARYKASLETREFDLYAPLFMFPGVDPPPQRILVALGKTIGCVRTIGFTGEHKPPLATSEICEFDLSERKVNSVLYKTSHEYREYSLYVPNEVFADEEPPQRIFIQIALPQE